MNWKGKIEMVKTGRLVRTKGGFKWKARKKKVPKGEHDWIKNPEMSRNNDLFYKSPHRQITESINVKCVRVIDGDTIEVKWEGRRFLFPVRFIDVYAPEKNTFEGRQAKRWLKNKIQGRDVYLKINPFRRIGKWGRLLAEVHFGGENINQALVNQGYAERPEPEIVIRRPRRLRRRRRR